MTAKLRLPFTDLRLAEDAAAVRAAIERVVASGWFVLGPEVEAFESELAGFAGTRFAVGVGNGTDAISVMLRGLDIGPGDEVVVPAITAAYTGLAVLAVGARPVIVDVDAATLTMDPAACASAVTSRTRAIVPVHLYGQPADMESIARIAERHRLAIVEDCCQALGATRRGTPVGTTTQGGAFSFYPTKNLGALGDGGAIVTNDEGLARRVRRLRNGGQVDRYHHEEPGVNSRLDELQAAILRARLQLVAGWTRRRRALASLYRSRLPDYIRPIEECDPGHVYHLFPVRSAQRDALQAQLRSEGIETLIHYPVPLSKQPAFAAASPGPCPVAEAAAGELLSLPLHPHVSDNDVMRVAEAVAAFQKGRQPA